MITCLEQLVTALLFYSLVAVFLCIYLLLSLITILVHCRKKKLRGHGRIHRCQISMSVTMMIFISDWLCERQTHNHSDSTKRLNTITITAATKIGEHSYLHAQLYFINISYNNSDELCSIEFSVRTLALRKMESLVASYGWSLLGISRTAGMASV